MLEQYRNAIRSHRIVATIAFIAICAGLVLVHQHRKHTTFVSYAFELGDAKSLSPQAVATQVRALIDARAVFSHRTGQRDSRRLDVRILTPRSGRVIVLSAEDRGSQTNREALKIIVDDTKKVLERADRAAIANLDVNIDKALSEQLQYAAEISRLTTLRQSAVENIANLERKAEQLEAQTRQSASGEAVLSTALNVANLRQQALSIRTSYLTRIEERLTSLRIAADTAAARLRAARAERVQYKSSRQLFGPHVEAGSGFGLPSWAILLAGAAFTSYVLLPLLLFRRRNEHDI